MGYSTFRILFRHILPNSIAPVTVVLTVEFAHAIALEATLSFLGRRLARHRTVARVSDLGRLQSFAER